MRLLFCLSLALLVGGASCGGGSTPAVETSAGGDGSGSSGSSSGSSGVSASGPQTAATTGSTSQATQSTADSAGDGTTSSGDEGTSSESSTTSGLSCHSFCGDSIVNCGEECDCGGKPCTPEGLGFATCAGMVDVLNPDHVITGGVLQCNAASCRFDLSQCEWGCGDGILVDGESCEPGLDAPSCADLGLGDSTEPVPCDETCQLDTSMCL